MPAEEALVSVRETASHGGQPTPVHPTFVILLVRNRMVGQRLTAAFRPLPVQALFSVADLHWAMAQRAGDVACLLQQVSDGVGILLVR